MVRGAQCFSALSALTSSSRTMGKNFQRSRGTSSCRTITKTSLEHVAARDSEPVQVHLNRVRDAAGAEVAGRSDGLTRHHNHVVHRSREPGLLRDRDAELGLCRVHRPVDLRAADRLDYVDDCELRELSRAGCDDETAARDHPELVRRHSASRDSDSRAGTGPTGEKREPGWSPAERNDVTLRRPEKLLAE